MNKVEKKKRGRKPKKVDFDEELSFGESSFEIKEQMIIHLPIKHEEIVNIDFSQVKVEEQKRNYIKEKVTVKKENPSVETFNKADRHSNISVDTVVNTFYAVPKENWSYDNCFKHKKTDVCCWWCTHQFENYPVYLPIKYTDKTDTFNVKGVFCSFECAASYGIKYEKNTTSLYLLKFFYKKITKSKGQADIKLAPPKEILERFGGCVPIEKYRENNHVIKGYVDDTAQTEFTENIENQGYFIHDFPVKYIPIQIGAKKLNKIMSETKAVKRKNKLIDL